MKKMTGREFAVHVVIWIVATVGLFVAWGLNDDYDRIMAAPEVSAMVNGLAGVLWMVVILYDLYKNEWRFKTFVAETLEESERNHQQRLQYVARCQAARKRKRERRQAQLK